MKKYFQLLKYEMKNIIRDSMSMAMLVYPLLMIAMGAFILPTVIEQFTEGGVGNYTASLVVIIILASIAPFITGALMGFGLLDVQDDNTLSTIRVTPLSLRGYLVFRSGYSYILSVNASFWTVYGVKLLSGDQYTFMGQNLFDGFTVGSVLLYALVGGLFTPVFALFLSAVAKNKIEGFAYMKATGMFLILPALVVLETMQGFKQYFLGVLPVFWPVKGLLVNAGLLDHDANISFSLYLIIGTFYSLVLIGVSYRVFTNKTQT